MENNFKNYKEYCDGFSNENIKLAFLLLLLRDNLSKLNKTEKIGLINLCEYKIVDDITLANNDILTNIVEKFINSFKFINQNLSTKLANENVLMHISKAKKLNSYSVNWLSRRPGNTVREKVANSNNKIQAGRRYQSVDTLENRLFKALCLRLEEYLSYKIEKLPKENIAYCEFELYYGILKFKKSEFFPMINRYETSAPNNRLLGDKHYKNARATLLNIGEIDNLLCFDIDKLSQEIAVIFFIGIIQKLSLRFHFPQEIVLIDYDNFDLKMFNKSVEFIVNDNKNGYKICYITLEENKIEFSVLEQNFTLEFNNDTITLSGLVANKKGKSNAKATLISEKINGNFDSLFTRIIGKILKDTRQDKASLPVLPTGELPENGVIDLFSTRPKFLAEDGTILYFKEKIILLKYDYQTEYKVLINSSSIIPINDKVEIISLENIFKKENFSDITLLLNPIKLNKSKNLTFIYPDKFNEFQLKEFHKNNMHYFARSMGLVFDYQYSKNFNLKENDFILSVDYVQNSITFTLIKAKYDNLVEEKIPESKGIIWERYPTNSYANDYYKSEVISILQQYNYPNPEAILDSIEVETLLTEKDNLFFKTENEVFHITSEIANKISKIKPLDIDNLVKDYLAEKSNLLETGTVKILYCTKITKGNNYDYDWFKGYEKYKTAQSKSRVSLWSDYVPSLYLKRLEENFTLCNGEDVKLSWGVKHKIELENEFVLASNIKEYEFPLLIGDEVIPTNKAVLKSNKVFPLSEPVICKLTMIYEYGGEEPFTLLFNSVDSEEAGFTQIKAEFVSITSYESENMEAPPFPEQSDWSLFKKYPNKDKFGKPRDLLDWTLSILNEIKEGKNIHKMDLTEHNATWRLSRNHRYTCDVNYINFNEQFFNDEFDPNRKAFYFTMHEDKFEYDRYIAKDITYSYESLNEKVIKQLSRSLFAFHTIFFNSRIIEDDNYEIEIQTEFYMLKEKLNEKLPKYERTLYITLLGLMSHNFSDSCYEIVEKYLNNNGNDVIKIGVYLGDIENLNQREIFRLLLEKYITDDDVNMKLIPTISNALWKNERLIYSIYEYDESLILKWLELSINHIVEKVQDVEKLKGEKFYNKRLFFSHLEFVLATLRLRTLNNSKLNVKLSMNDKNIQKLVRSLENLKTSGMEIKTFLVIETNENVKNPLLYMLLKYLYNDIVESFVIKAPTDELVEKL